jgi:hypothetical protein
MSEFESPDEAKFESFMSELTAFNRKTNNYLGFATIGFPQWLKYMDHQNPVLVRHGLLADSVRLAMEERGITNQDLFLFHKIRYKTRPLTAENYTLAVKILLALKEIFEELQTGKYHGIKFVAGEICGYEYKE